MTIITAKDSAGCWIRAKGWKLLDSTRFLLEGADIDIFRYTVCCDEQPLVRRSAHLRGPFTGSSTMRLDAETSSAAGASHPCTTLLLSLQVKRSGAFQFHECCTAETTRDGGMRAAAGLHLIAYTALRLHGVELVALTRSILMSTTTA